MTSAEFVENCYQEKQEMLKTYFDEKNETYVGELIKQMVSKGITNDEMKSLINSVMNESFYTMLLALDGEAALGDSQVMYELYDDNHNLLTGSGEIESTAFEMFMQD